MRYNLGLMDKYPIEAAGSVIENNPMYRVVFKSIIDPIKLEEATNEALKVYPLFKTKVKFDKEYYLETNNALIKIIKAKEEERPLVFGATTNDYPWQICYFENKLTFEWLHGVTDGVGAFRFLSQILCNYCGYKAKEPNQKMLLASGLEPFFDSKEKGIDFKQESSGFSFNEFKVFKNRGYQSDCHTLVADTKEILEVAKVCESSVAPVITVLFARALRNHLPDSSKNKNVACNVVVDLRRPLNYETMHNCVEYKRITYNENDHYSSFKTVAKRYKKVLDEARLVPNVVRIITERVKTFRLYHILPSKKFLKMCIKIIGKILKDIDCNFVVTYPGKLDLPKKVYDKIDNIDFKVWHDFGECLIACVDYNGKFNVNICENFIQKGIVEDFIRLASDLGIHFEVIDESVHTQAHFEE